MNLLPLGVSNRLFYYMNGGEEAAFDVCVRCDLHEALDRQALAGAVQHALRNFPEFAFRPVLHEGTVWAQPVSAEVPLLEDDGRVLRYGTGETAGYIFAFRCRKDGFSFAYFHGLTDFYGSWHFLHTVFYYYALARGLSVSPNEYVRTDDTAALTMDERERLDPYLAFCPPADRQVQPGVAVDAFALPDKPYDSAVPYARSYEISFPLPQFLQTVKDGQTSVVALLSLLAARAVTDLYETGGKPVRMMVSANIRKYYGTETMVNFSDATTLTYDEALAALPEEEQGKELRRSLMGQLCREHFDGLIAQKVKAVQGMVDSRVPITEWLRRLAGPPAEPAPNPVTVPLTYCGRLDFPPEYGTLIRRISRDICIRGLGNFGLAASTYGDTMHIRTIQRFESDALIRNIRQKVEELGLPVEMHTPGSYAGNQLIVSSLPSV